MQGKVAVKPPTVAQVAKSVSPVVAPAKFTGYATNAPVSKPVAQIGGSTLQALQSQTGTPLASKPPAVQALYADARNTDPHSMFTADQARTILTSNQNLTPRALATAIQSLGISTDVSGKAAEIYAANGNRIPAGFTNYYAFAMSLYNSPTVPMMSTPAPTAPTHTTANLIPAGILTGAVRFTPSSTPAPTNAPVDRLPPVAVSPVSVPSSTVPVTSPAMASHMPGDVSSPALYYGGGGGPVTLSVPSSSMSPLLLVAGAGVVLLLLSSKRRKA
jgi:hypothetical protein